MKSNPTILSLLSLALLALQLHAQPATPVVGIIPAPAKCEAGTGHFALGAKTKIVWRGDTAESAGRFLQAGFNERHSLRLDLTKVATDETPGAILLHADAAFSAKSDEAYQLTIGTSGVTIRARGEAGLFYGVQSLLQLADAAPQMQLPVVTIADEPRFVWRGLMLDESRHFFGKQTVKEVLDVMAMLKLNRFHWHLTDEPGWRIEIKKYPKLTEVGARGNWSDTSAPAAFYTQADIREIVEYARQRHIMIIPEIDMPGHANAATRAYPEVSGGGTGQWDGFTFNPAKEETYRFLEDVLAEVATLFPGPYLHLGGDEVHFGNQSWRTDPAIVAFSKTQGFTNSVQLEHYFLRRMAGVIRKLGKTTMGWDEIAGAGISPEESALFWWRHDKPKVLRQLLAADYPVVLCPRHPCYLDFVQDDSHHHGRRWNGFNDLARTYKFPEPVTDGLIPAGKEVKVLGVEACLWTERVQNRERLGFMLYPRLAAVAEAAWTPANAKDEAGFMQRVPQFQRKLERRKIPFFNPFAPAKTPEPPGPARRGGGTANG